MPFSQGQKQAQPKRPLILNLMHLLEHGFLINLEGTAVYKNPAPTQLPPTKQTVQPPHTRQSQADWGCGANTIAKPCAMLWGKRCELQGNAVALEGYVGSKSLQVVSL